MLKDIIIMLNISRLLRYSLLFCLPCMTLSMLQAQHPNVLITNFSSPNEPSICLNPKNPSQVVAGVNLNLVMWSSDGGATWSENELTSTYGVWGDPCIITDTSGNFYYLHLSNPDQGNWIDRIVCQKMTTFGGAWTNGSYTHVDGTKAQDKEWAVVDPATNIIYCTWTQFDDYGSSSPADSSLILFSRSADEGGSWSPAVRINRVAGDCIDEDNTVEGAVPAVGPDGEVYVAWAGPAGLVFDRSLDQGQTWLDEDVVITSIPGGWDFSVPGIYRCNGLPVTCCDISNGPYRGNIYVNWTDQRNGAGDTDVWLVKSTDGGNTWSALKRVNNDPPGKQQFFTWMTVDQATGYLWFVFYDRRNYSNNNTDVYMAVSTDGGETFTNFKVSQTPFLPLAQVFFGDYTNITAYNNVVRPIWTRLQGGALSIYTALVDPTLVGMEEELTGPSVGEPFPNPFSEELYFSFKLQRSVKVTLELTDMTGRVIRTLIDNERRTAGKYIESFNAKAAGLRPGAYFFHFQSDQANYFKRVVFVE